MILIKNRAIAAVMLLSILPAVNAQDSPSDWRSLDPENILYMQLESGRVIIELAPRLAPNHVENIKTLVRENYFDQQRINRVQDNFVVQWGEPVGAKPFRKAKRVLFPEFMQPSEGLDFTPLPDADTYAPQTGFIDGFPAARNSDKGQTWAVHCYGTVGVGRDTAADSGNGAELYAVIGHAPRQLDRNVTVVGRVVQGMSLLSSLPRGAKSMGFYERRDQHTVIKSIRVAADVPAAEREPLEALRTDSPRFATQLEAKRNSKDEWYKAPAGHLDVCNVPLPVRRARKD